MKTKLQKMLLVFLSLILVAEVTFLITTKHKSSQYSLPIQPVVATTTTKIVYTAEQIKKYRSEQEAKVKSELEVHFAPEEQKIALAIIKQESQLNPRAMNYNCLYDSFGTINGTSTPIKSRSCKKGDQQYAWSVDCGIIMLNRKGLKCEEEDFDISLSISKMKQLYEKRGWQPWVGYTSGRYKEFM